MSSTFCAKYKGKKSREQTIRKVPNMLTMSLPSQSPEEVDARGNVVIAFHKEILNDSLRDILCSSNCPIAAEFLASLFEESRNDQEIA